MLIPDISFILITWESAFLAVINDSLVERGVMFPKDFLGVPTSHTLLDAA